MKKTLYLLLLCMCVLTLFVSCSEKKDPELAAATETTAQEPVIHEPVRTTQSSVILKDETPFYLESEDGKMRYANVDGKLGDKLSIILLDGEIAQKNAIRVTSDNKEAEFLFVRVEYNNTDYWTRDIYITKDPSLVPAVIKNDVFTYKSPDISDPYPSKDKLTIGTIIAAGNTVTTEDETFVTVVKYDGTAFGKEMYIKDSSLTTKPADIVAVQTLNRIDGYQELEDVVFCELILQIQNLDLSPDVRDYLGF